MRGRGDEAMVELRRAVQMGWRAAWLAERQPYLQLLRSRSDYRELLAAVNARNAETAANFGRDCYRSFGLGGGQSAGAPPPPPPEFA